MPECNDGYPDRQPTGKYVIFTVRFERGSLACLGGLQVTTLFTITNLTAPHKMDTHS